MKLLAYVALAVASTTLAHATVITANDPFYVGDNGGDASYDVIGDRMKFDIQGASVNITPTLVTADLYLNYGGGASLSEFNFDKTLKLDIGDLMFYNANSTAPAYAVPLASHAGSPNGGPSGNTLTAGSLYSINDSSGYLTAQQVLNTNSYTYRPSVIVWARDDGNKSVTQLSTGTVTVSNYGDGVSNALYDVNVSFVPTSDFVLASTKAGFGFNFASATCGNDIASGYIPEPMTFLYMGSGLLAIGLFRRKKTSDSQPQ
jgi:hypothetical protein